MTFFTRMNVICHKNKKQNNKLEILKLNPKNTVSYKKTCTKTQKIFVLAYKLI